MVAFILAASASGSCHSSCWLIVTLSQHTYLLTYLLGHLNGTEPMLSTSVQYMLANNISQ